MPDVQFPKLRPHPFRSSGDVVQTHEHDDSPDGGYAELCVTSNFTFLCGASHPEEFMQTAADWSYRAVAITDLHSLAGVVRAHVAAKQAGMQFILGARLRLEDLDGISIHVYPTDRVSYGRLCRLLTVGKRRTEKGACRLMLNDVIAHADGLLAIALPDADRYDDGEAALRQLRSIFDADRLSLGACMRYDADDARRLECTVRLARRIDVPLVATNNVHYHVPDRRPLQDVLTCVRHGCTLSEAGFRLAANAERHLKTPAEMRRLFRSIPGAVDRTLDIAERAAGFNLDQLRYEYPSEVVPEGLTAMQHLTDLAWQGAAERYPEGISDKIIKQVNYELRLIEELNYAPYFLTVHDLVSFARGRGILCQGRGAAANSAVCFCLGVTSVDPEYIDVLFERFVSRERDEPPDIDIDFEHERREEVIQYIYGKYGRDRAALTAEVISYRRRSAIRDVGKAMGLSLDLVDLMAKSIEWWDEGRFDPARLREMGLNPDDDTLRLMMRLTHEISAFPRHLSQHVGGFVISQGPLCELVPIENAAMADRTVIEWDKDDIDALGLLKVDVLGLGMLTALRRCLDMVNARRNVEGAQQQGVKVSRCRGVEEEKGSSYEDSIVSGSHRVAEGEGALQDGLSGNRKDATGGDLRADGADAAGSGIDSIEHRRGLQPQDPAGVHARPESSQRLPGGTVHPVGDCNGTGDDPAGCIHRGAFNRNRPNAVCADLQPDDEVVTPPPSTPRHFDTLTPRPLQLHTIPPEDPQTYEMIQRADTVGVFQIESRAQMSMLPRLRPACFYDLVIEVAIVRPGPIQGDMVHPYLRRRNGLEPVEHIHPSLDEVLDKTLGVPLFQEQCMALAVKAAGFTPGEADQLRRAMAAWKRKGDQIVRFGQKLISGMVANGIPREFAERCFQQIQGFSEYGFPESHAASFALLVYASAWLKRHHPAEFTAALLNSQPMGFYAPAQLVRDAVEHGVVVRPVDVNHSGWDCSIEPDGAVRLGMNRASGVGEEEAWKIETTVANCGPFRNMLSLWRESGARAVAFRRLAAADAFGSMGLSRQKALWQARALKDDILPLFEAELDAARPEEAPALPPFSIAREVVVDYVATGLSLRHHPVSFLREELREAGVIVCSDLRDPAKTPAGRLVAVAGLVLVRQRPGTAKGVTFMTLEDETGIANIVAWAQVYERNRRAAGENLLIIHGEVQREGEVVHVVARKFMRFVARKTNAVTENLAVASRDFR